MDEQVKEVVGALREITTVLEQAFPGVESHSTLRRANNALRAIDARPAPCPPPPPAYHGYIIAGANGKDVQVQDATIDDLRHAVMYLTDALEEIDEKVSETLIEIIQTKYRGTGRRG
jgi:hypothetical protein